MNKKEGYDTFVKDDGTTHKICNNCNYLHKFEGPNTHDYQKDYGFCELLSEKSISGYQKYTLIRKDQLGNFNTPNTFEFGGTGNRCPLHLSIIRNEKLENIFIQ